MVIVLCVNIHLQIDHGPAYLTLGGNLVIFATIFVFFVYAEQEDGFPSGF